MYAVKVTVRDSAVGPDGRSYPITREIILRRVGDIEEAVRRLGYSPADIIMQEVAE